VKIWTKVKCHVFMAHGVNWNRRLRSYTQSAARAHRGLKRWGQGNKLQFPTKYSYNYWFVRKPCFPSAEYLVRASRGSFAISPTRSIHINSRTRTAFVVPSIDEDITHQIYCKVQAVTKSRTRDLAAFRYYLVFPTINAMLRWKFCRWY